MNTDARESVNTDARMIVTAERAGWRGETWGDEGGSETAPYFKLG